MRMFGRRRTEEFPVYSCKNHPAGLCRHKIIGVIKEVINGQLKGNFLLHYFFLERKVKKEVAIYKDVVRIDVSVVVEIHKPIFAAIVSACRHGSFPGQVIVKELQVSAVTASVGESEIIFLTRIADRTRSPYFTVAPCSRFN